MQHPWEVNGRPGWVLGDIVRRLDGWYEVAVFHHVSRTGSRICAPTEPRLRFRAQIEVDLIYERCAQKLGSLLRQDEAEGGLVRMIR